MFVIGSDPSSNSLTFILSNTRNKYVMTAEEIQSQIEELESQLTGDMFSDMEIKDKIHNLKMKLNGTRPMNSEIECVGCGS